MFQFSVPFGEGYKRRNDRKEIQSQFARKLSDRDLRVSGVAEVMIREKNGDKKEK